MGGRGSTGRRPPSQKPNSRIGVAASHLPGRSNSMIRRAFPCPRSVPRLQGRGEFQRIQSRRLQDPPDSSSVSTLPATVSGPLHVQKASSTHGPIKPASNIPLVSAPPNHERPRAIYNWQNTAIDPGLKGNTPDSCLRVNSQEFSVNRGIMAEMFNLITDEARTPVGLAILHDGGGDRIEENRDSPIYEFVARGLLNEETYQDYLRSEIEKLVKKFEAEYNAYLQHQSHTSTVMKLSGRATRQHTDIIPMARSGEVSTDTSPGPGVPTMESGQSYGSTEGSESLRLFVPKPEVPVFTGHDLMPGLEFNWNHSAMPPPPLPPPPPPPMAQGLSNFPTDFEGYLPASGFVIGSPQGLTHSYMSPYFLSGPTSYPIQILRQNALQMNQIQSVQTPTRLDDMIMQTPQVPSNSTPQQASLIRSFPRPYNRSPHPVPGPLQRCHTTDSSFLQRKRSAPDS